MERMASCFDETGFACYLWIIGKVASKFGSEATGPGGEGLAGLLGGAFEKVTGVLARRLGEKTAVEMPDGKYFFHSLTPFRLSFSFFHCLYLLPSHQPYAIYLRHLRLSRPFW